MKKLMLAAVAVVGIAGAAAGVREYRDGRITGYHVGDGFPMVRSPSLYLDLKEYAGLQTFYSQLGQDKWILGKVFPGVTDGYFVDVGAWDAELLSNTKALEDQGWTGVCIEPFPRNWTNRKCQLFEEIVYSLPGQIVQFRKADGLGGIDSHIGRYTEQVTEYPVLELTTTTLADVLARANAPRYIHYMSIDTEGSELEILKGLPFSEYTIGAFTIEHNYEEPRRRQIRAMLGSLGYRFVREQLVDDWYVLAPAP